LTDGLPRKASGASERCSSYALRRAREKARAEARSYLLVIVFKISSRFGYDTVTIRNLFARERRRRARRRRARWQAVALLRHKCRGRRHGEVGGFVPSLRWGRLSLVLYSVTFSKNQCSVYGNKDEAS
jgi:hypothetical protein